MKKVKIKNNKGYGFVSVWRDGKLGWFMPAHLTGYSRRYGVDSPNGHECQKGERAYLCEISVKLVKSKNGRVITRIVK